jgi:5-methylcytosine-specific restriction endonuclease McrA
VRETRVERGHGQGDGRQAERAERRAERGNGKGQARQAERRADQGQRAERHADRSSRNFETRDWAGWSNRTRSSDRLADRFAYWREGRTLPVSVGRRGCPPGLASQNAFCLPPGQLRRSHLIGQRISRANYRRVPENYLYRFSDGGGFYHLFDDDGFIYRIDQQTDLVSSIIPLFATNLLVGEPLPLGYDVYNLPVPYRDFYSDDQDYSYRYDDGAIYRVDNDTRLIDSVVALLTGNPITVGSALPTGYDVYNVPFDYRDRYADSDESLYRYSNGAIYQVDPTTQLVEALVDMIV